jgi:hypothetical protein
MTQRAKLRRLAFIDLPSWSRGSRPYISLGRREGSPGRLRYNLGVAAVAAKGTEWDYLAYLSVIPVQIMALVRVSSRVVKTAREDLEMTFATTLHLNQFG